MSRRPPRAGALTAPALQILLSLSRGALHGYGIKLDIEERTGGEISLGSGTLYQALQRLEDRGLICETDIPGGADDARRGRHYTLTPRGESVLESELALLRRTLAWASSPAAGTSSS